MASVLQNILNFFKPKERRIVLLDEDSVREHNTIKALANENAELKGLLAKYQLKEGKRREREQDKKEDEEVRWELNKQKTEIERKSYPSYFSLLAFCRKLIYNKKLKEKLGFYSFDRKTKLANFGDIGISESGQLVLIDDKGEVLIALEKPKDIFQSCGALGHDVQSGKIPLNVDSDGNYVENIMIWEAPELIPTIDGKFQYSTARKKPLYEYIKELNARISAYQEDLEEKEMTLTELQKENDDLKISQRVAEDMSQTSRKDLASVERETSAIRRIFSATEKELTQLREINAIQEDKLEKLEREFEKMRDEAEGTNTKLSYERALESIKNVRRELVRDEPSKEVRIVEKPIQNT